jgi:hypothetical protein
LFINTKLNDNTNFNNVYFLITPPLVKLNRKFLKSIKIKKILDLPRTVVQFLKLKPKQK